MQRELFRLVSGISRSMVKMSKGNSYYPPPINLRMDMTPNEILIELDKLERFLRTPELSYMVKNTHPDYQKSR
jgi:hypothetical protein